MSDPAQPTIYQISETASTPPPEVRILVTEDGGADGISTTTTKFDVKDDAGNWRPDIVIPPVRVIDDPTAENEADRKRGSLVTSLILNAKVDGEHPAAKALGIAADISIAQALAALAAPKPQKEETPDETGPAADPGSADRQA